MEDLSFNNCTIDSLSLGGRLKAHAFFVIKSRKIGNISIGPAVSGYYFDLYDYPRIRNVEIRGKIENVRLVNKRQHSTSDKPTDRPLNYISHQSIGMVSLEISQMASVVVELIKTQELRIHGSGSAGKVRFSHIYAAKLVFQEFASPNTTLNKVDAEFQSEGRLEIYSSDLSGVRFHDCRLAVAASIRSSTLEKATTLDSEWPLELEGTGEAKHAAYRQLRLLHKAQGSHRKQIHYLKLEMSAFKSMEDKELRKEKKKIKGIVSLWHWLSRWVEHLIKVRLPHFASRFGSLTGRPLVIFIIAWILITNTLIFFQRHELGIIHAWVWLSEWDFSLFFHITLPTHRGLFHERILLEWIDIPWKIISAYLIYHIVVSSRMLVKS